MTPTLTHIKNSMIKGWNRLRYRITNRRQIRQYGITSRTAAEGYPVVYEGISEGIQALKPGTVHYDPSNPYGLIDQQYDIAFPTFSGPGYPANVTDTGYPSDLNPWTEADGFAWYAGYGVDGGDVSPVVKTWLSNSSNHWCPFLRSYGRWISYDNTPPSADTGVPITPLYYTQWTAEWTSQQVVNFPADGFYCFETCADNEVTVMVDGGTVSLDDSVSEPVSYVCDSMGEELILGYNIRAGNHTVTMRAKNWSSGTDKTATSFTGDNPASVALRITYDPDCHYQQDLLAQQQQTQAEAEQAQAEAEQAVNAAQWVLVDNTTTTVNCEAGQEASFQDQYMGGSTRVWISADAWADAGGDVTDTDLSASATVGCVVKAGETVDVSLSAGPVVAQAQGTVYMQSGAEAEVIVEMGESGVDLEGGCAIGACVGAEGSGTVTFGPTQETATAGAEFGEDYFALSAGGQAQYKDGHLQLGISGEAAAFVGIDFDLEIDIDVLEAWSDLAQLGMTTYDEALQVYNDAVAAYNVSVSAVTAAEADAQAAIDTCYNAVVNEATKEMEDWKSWCDKWLNPLNWFS